MNQTIRFNPDLQTIWQKLDAGSSSKFECFKDLKLTIQFQIQKFFEEIPYFPYLKIILSKDSVSFDVKKEGILPLLFGMGADEITETVWKIFDSLLDYQFFIFEKFQLDDLSPQIYEVLYQETEDLILKILDSKSNPIALVIQTRCEKNHQKELQDFEQNFLKDLETNKFNKLRNYVENYEVFQSNYLVSNPPSKNRIRPTLILQKSKLYQAVKGLILHHFYKNLLKTKSCCSEIEDEIKQIFEGFVFSNPPIELSDYRTFGEQDSLIDLYHIILLTDYRGEDKESLKHIIQMLTRFYELLVDKNPLLENSFKLMKSQHFGSPNDEMLSNLLYFKDCWQYKIKNRSLNLMAMVWSFLAFNFVSPESKTEKTYDPLLRRMLKSLFRNLQDGTYQCSNFQILSSIETISKYYEEKSKKDGFMSTSTSIVFKKIRNTQINSYYEHVSYQDQLKSLHHKFSSKIEEPEKFIFEKISSHKNNSKVLTILVSGFTSEMDIKLEQWKAICDLYPYSEALAVNWKSSSIQNILENLMKSIVPSIGELVIGATAFFFTGKVGNGLVPQVALEEWHKTYRQAKIAGIYLAHIMADTNIFKGHVINLVGFSLGTLVVMNCIWELEKLGRNDIIYDVLVMGGVVHIDDFYKSELKVINNKLINCYCKTDNILKHLLKATNHDVSPIGLGPILWPNKKIRNIDVTSVADGHTKYREKLADILARTDFNEDIEYMFE